MSILTDTPVIIKDLPLEDTLDPRKDKITRTQLLSEHATLSFLLCACFYKITGSDLRVDHSIGDGLYCRDPAGDDISEDTIKRLNEELFDAVNNDKEISLLDVTRRELMVIFTDLKRADKVGVLKAWQDHFIPCVMYDNFIDYRVEPMCTNKDRLKIFEIRKYGNGLVLRFPTLLSPNAIPQWVDHPILHDMFVEDEEWANLLQVDCAGKLNAAIYDHSIDTIMRTNEGLHEMKIAKIAEKLTTTYDSKRIVIVSGPSASNMSTFAHRIAIQLLVNGYSTVKLDMADFMKDKSNIPTNEDGKGDYEHVSAYDIEMVVNRANMLLSGQSVPVRRYDYVNGAGYELPRKSLTMPKKSFLIIQGLYCLNPQFINLIGRDRVTSIYVAALTPINIDLNHRFPTSDLRLIRRIIRDHNFRGIATRKTIKRWTSVRVGEARNVFPFYEQADMFFNSALVYEVPVLLIYGYPLLCEATIPDPDEDPESQEAIETTEEARRLLGLLKFFYPIAPGRVSKISCLREFIGGSELKY